MAPEVLLYPAEDPGAVVARLRERPDELDLDHDEASVRAPDSRSGGIYFVAAPGADL